ncbi:hypothetical protein [Brevibacterium album]|uniref:hypothetical protein n=1 Tax=Brevibacterium album TaxID=417948 RepID=UPI0012EC7F5F|nr:hypothetical protein [Brevibacterium album]
MNEEVIRLTAVDEAQIAAGSMELPDIIKEVDTRGSRLTEEKLKWAHNLARSAKVVLPDD